jgi:hypothetical protein
MYKEGLNFQIVSSLQLCPFFLLLLWLYKELPCFCVTQKAGIRSSSETKRLGAWESSPYFFLKPCKSFHHTTYFLWWPRSSLTWTCLWTMLRTRAKDDLACLMGQKQNVSLKSFLEWFSKLHLKSYSKSCDFPLLWRPPIIICFNTSQQWHSTWTQMVLTLSLTQFYTASSFPSIICFHKLELGWLFPHCL